MTTLDFLQIDVAGNKLQDWVIAATIATAVMLLAGFVRLLLARQLNQMVQRTDSPLWNILLVVVKCTKWIFIFIVALFIGSLALDLTGKSLELLKALTVIALLIQSGLWASKALQVTIEHYRKEQITKDPASVTTLNVLNFIGKVFLWAIILLLVLDNLGVNITALVAGLGVGGIAVALAVQTILGDLFASLSIVLDKPFVIGDFLIVGDLMGSVEHIGLKTTRLRSLSGEQLVFSNSDLLNSRIRNYGRMYERRVAFDLGVTYQTSREKLKLIPGIVREAVEKQEKIRFDRSHFKQYGNFSLVFESVYYVLGPDYNEYMDVQQEINLHIHECFEREGIEFAYPTQTLFMHTSS